MILPLANAYLATLDAKYALASFRQQTSSGHRAGNIRFQPNEYMLGVEEEVSLVAYISLGPAHAERWLGTMHQHPKLSFLRIRGGVIW